MDPTGVEEQVEIDGRRFHLRAWGEGPAVLLIHGAPSNGELWREVAPRLAARARVVAPDLLGYGRSGPPDGAPVDLEAQTSYMLRLLDALGVQRATVVGHDIGGGIAQLLAVRHAERVERLGLVNCVCYDNWPVPEMRAVQATGPALKHLPPRVTIRGIGLGLRRGFVHPERAERYLETFLAPFSDPQGLRRFVELTRALDNGPTVEIAPRLGQLRVPVAVAWGRQDPFLPPQWAERLASDIPAAELTWIDDASHFAPADAPPAVADALLRLLERS